MVYLGFHSGFLSDPAFFSSWLAFSMPLPISETALSN
jgi:hypothetical protein